MGDAHEQFEKDREKYKLNMKIFKNKIDLPFEAMEAEGRY